MTDFENRTDARNQRLSFILLTFTVFFGASLLFSMEPLVGRLLTPYFGGAAHVWLTCLMFFQAMLLLGYLYAHILVRKLGAWHLLFLIIPLVSLPLQIGAVPNPGAPILAVLMALVFHVALPFIALSTTAVVAQTWLANSTAGRNKEPYPLYAASNAGSLLALLSYAFLIEPFSGLRLQSLVWSWAYALYVLLALVSWFLLRPGKEHREDPTAKIKPATPQPLARTLYVQWLLLSALPSAFLLAATNHVTLEVGSFPFIWVIPLALYLGSFVVTFRTRGGVPGSLGVIWIEVLLLGFLLYFAGISLSLSIIANQCVFFSICLIAHGNLYKRRPPAQYLTNFYLTSALGGWIGGILISLIAPFLFSGLFEYPILLLLLGGTFWWCHHSDFFNFWRHVTFREGAIRLLLLTIIVVLLAASGYRSFMEPTKFRLRNFYGAYRVKDEPRADIPGGLRRLWHGGTIHGSQLLRQDLRSVPTSYYGAGSGIFDVFETIPSPRRVAILGLGCGVVSVYAKPDDMITYFEIDPDVEKIARRWFTYLEDCKGKVQMFFGDGRLLMQNSESYTHEYDLILIDAFTGDGIPTHLLTREAIQIYLSRLSPNGVIVFHVSNRYYDLRPVLKGIAAELKLLGATKDDRRTIIKPYQDNSIYMAVTRSPEQIEPLVKRGWKQLGNGDGLKHAEAWTDDHINIIGALNDWSAEPVWIGAVLKQKFKAYWAKHMTR